MIKIADTNQNNTIVNITGTTKLADTNVYGPLKMSLDKTEKNLKVVATIDQIPEPDPFITEAEIDEIFGEVSLYYYAKNNIDDYMKVQAIPQKNLDYLNSSLIVSNLSACFFECEELITIPAFTDIDTSKVKDMSHICENCNNLSTVNFSNFNTGNVEDMSFMFDSCYKLITIDISGFDTKKVQTFEQAFYSCSELTTIKGTIDMAACTEYNNMVDGCSKLAGVQIKNPPQDTNWWEQAGFTSQTQFTIVT